MTWVENGGATPDSDPDIYNVFGRPAPAGAIELVSRPPGSGAFLLPAANDYNYQDYTRRISADGRYIVFASDSHRLAESNGGRQIYRRDMETGEIELVSRASGADGAISESGGENASISADGSRVAFTSYSPLDPAHLGANNQTYLRDLDTKATYLVSRQSGAAGAEADNDSYATSISGDGNRVAFESEAGNLGAPGGYDQVFVRDIATDQTIIASRAAGLAGAIANGESGGGRLSGDGRRLAFVSRATNLSPDDAAPNSDAYFRDLATGETLLLSRQSGLAGAPATGFTYEPAISADGNVVAFQTEDQTTAPEAGAWPPGVPQILARNVVTGQNTLVSRAPGGAAANARSDSPSLSADGSVVSFETQADNLVAGLGGENRGAVFARDMATGALSAPPAFGLVDNEPQQGARVPSISDNGQCLSFNANGFTAASGDASDMDTDYIYVVSGTCSNPRIADPVPAGPRLSKVKLTPKRFAVSGKKTAKVAAGISKKKGKKAKKGTKIRFRLDTNARVTVRIDRKTKGRKVKGKCRKASSKNKSKKKCQRYSKAGKLVRKNLKPGARKINFSGRIGKKKLKPGKYRASVTAYNSGGSSKTVKRSFVVVRR